jgi:two-component system, chemotaxis family, chemotaxis protein CheY
MDLKEFLNRPAASLARRTGRVLVVDDSKTTRNIVTKLLDSIGISDVLDRESASDAFEILQQQRIGLVIADVEMLPISGLDLLKAIRANPRTSKIPVLLMTASYDPRHLSKAKALGAAGYLLKPFSADKLSKAIQVVYSQPLANLPDNDPGHGSAIPETGATEMVERWSEKKQNF